MSDLGPFYRDVVALDPAEPWAAASAAHRLELLARTLPVPIAGARLVPSNNNDVWRMPAGYLRVAWRGDRSRLAREAELLHRLRGVVPVPEVLDRGGDDRLAWSLTAAVPGTPLAEVSPTAPELRDLVRESADALRTLHTWPVPDELAGSLRIPEIEPDPLRRAGGQLVLPSAAALDLLPLVRQLPFVDPGVLDEAARRLAEPVAPAGDADVLLHGDFYLGNVLVHDGRLSGLIDFEFARLGPPDLELFSIVRALDVETRFGVPRPPLLAWLAQDYPALFDAADPWRHALAYAVRHVLFWPPDRAESDGLDPTHPLHSLRRLVTTEPEPPTG
jgi:aminoglycoside phosphotransferase (APT) family kinase protein